VGIARKEYKSVREFIFLCGQIWVLKDSQELAVASLDGGSLGLLVFTDEDLARTYAEENKLVGKEAKPIAGNQNVVSFLISVKALGVTHLVIDHTFGQKAHSTSIDKAISDAQQAIENKDN
jgi:hypothetical protein